MTTKVTKESLAENIGRLESNPHLSLNEEYQLEAYRMLLDLTPNDCPHNWEETGLDGVITCLKCGYRR